MIVYFSVVNEPDSEVDSTNQNPQPDIVLNTGGHSVETGLIVVADQNSAFAVSCNMVIAWLFVLINY